MKGRAITEDEKRGVINRIYRAWCLVPEQRLGQLLSNSRDQRDIFYTEDLDLVASVEALVTKCTGRVFLP